MARCARAPLDAVVAKLLRRGEASATHKMLGAYFETSRDNPERVIVNGEVWIVGGRHKNRLFDLFQLYVMANSAVGMVLSDENLRRISCVREKMETAA